MAVRSGDKPLYLFKWRLKGLGGQVRGPHRAVGNLSKERSERLEIGREGTNTAFGSSAEKRSSRRSASQSVEEKSQNLPFRHFHIFGQALRETKILNKKPKGRLDKDT